MEKNAKLDWVVDQFDGDNRYTAHFNGQKAGLTIYHNGKSWVLVYIDFQSNGALIDMTFRISAPTFYAVKTLKLYAEHIFEAMEDFKKNSMHLGFQV
ncbi:hypothetical protein EBU94_02030 [bacterium]|nr:hypothetical protein [bacterium]